MLDPPGHATRVAEVGVGVGRVEGAAGAAVPLIWAPTLPSSSNWLTLEEVPPASISIMISKPIVTLGLTSTRTPAAMHVYYGIDASTEPKI